MDDIPNLLINPDCPIVVIDYYDSSVFIYHLITINDLSICSQCKNTSMCNNIFTPASWDDEELDKQTMLGLSGVTEH